VVKWLEGCIDESKLSNIGVPLVWKHTAFEVDGDVTVISNYKLDLQQTGSFKQDEWGPWKDVVVIPSTLDPLIRSPSSVDTITSHSGAGRAFQRGN